MSFILLGSFRKSPFGERDGPTGTVRPFLIITPLCKAWYPEIKQRADGDRKAIFPMKVQKLKF